MTERFPYFTLGLPEAKARKSLVASKIPTFSNEGLIAPYEMDPDLAYAVNVALVLGQPLLVTGEPGVGKTALARAVADEIGAKLIPFETQSVSEARDLFYTYDAISAFKRKDIRDQRRFIQYRALGRAILESFPRAEVDHLLSQDDPHKTAHRSLVLIDEIDKAPRDFPNNLLNQIDKLYFRVPELDDNGSPGAAEGRSVIPPNLRPIVIITSNSEKTLPDPFLRRCVYFHIPFPGEEQMARILSAHLKNDLGGEQSLIKDAIRFFYQLRDSRRGFAKPPTTAELLNWMIVLLRSGLRPDTRLSSNTEIVKRTLGALMKTERDLTDASLVVNELLEGPAGAVRK